MSHSPAAALDPLRLLHLEAWTLTAFHRGWRLNAGQFCVRVRQSLVEGFELSPQLCDLVLVPLYLRRGYKRTQT